MKATRLAIVFLLVLAGCSSERPPSAPASSTASALGTPSPSPSEPKGEALSCDQPVTDYYLTEKQILRMVNIYAEAIRYVAGSRAGRSTKIYVADFLEDYWADDLIPEFDIPSGVRSEIERKLSDEMDLEFCAYFPSEPLNQAAITLGPPLVVDERVRLSVYIEHSGSMDLILKRRGRRYEVVKTSSGVDF